MALSACPASAAVRVGKLTKRDIVCTRRERSLLQRGWPLIIAKACSLETSYGVPSGAKTAKLRRRAPATLVGSCRAAKQGRLTICTNTRQKEQPAVQSKAYLWRRQIFLNRTRVSRNEWCGLCLKLLANNSCIDCRTTTAAAFSATRNKSD